MSLCKRTSDSRDYTKSAVGLEKVLGNTILDLFKSKQLVRRVHSSYHSHDMEKVLRTSKDSTSPSDGGGRLDSLGDD